MRTNRVSCRVMLAAVTIFTGCGRVIEFAGQSVGQATQAANNAQVRDDLKAMGMAYHRHLETHTAPPQDWAALESFVGSQSPASLESIRRLRESGVVTKWGVHFRDATIGSSNYLLVYQQDALSSGGWVLLLDGSVHRMDAGQVQKALDLREGRLPAERAHEIWEPASSTAQTPNPRTPPPPPPTPLVIIPPTQPSFEKAGSVVSENTPVQDSSVVARVDQRPQQVEAEAAAEDARQAAAQTAASASTGAPTAPARLRTWSDATGKFTVEAEMVGYRNGIVTLRRQDGIAVDVPIERLVESDRAYVERVAADTPAPARPGEPQETRLVGGKGGWEFRAVGQKPLLGIRCSMGRWAGQDALGKIEAVFEREATAGQELLAIARPGFAVGGMNVHASDYVNALQLVFMRLRPDGRLDPADSYTSDWIGKPAKKRPVSLAGTGSIVVGIHGRHGSIVDALGLVVLAQDPGGPSNVVPRN